MGKRFNVLSVIIMTIKKERERERERKGKGETKELRADG